MGGEEMRLKKIRVEFEFTKFLIWFGVRFK